MDEDQRAAGEAADLPAVGVPARGGRRDGGRRRRWRLTEARRQTILSILAVGGSRAGAARYVGCSATTLRRAAKKDAEFREQMRQALAAPEVVCLQRIVEAAKETKNWRAAAWALERRFPERYGRRTAQALGRHALAGFVERLGEIVAEEVREVAAQRRVLARLRRLVRKETRG